MTRFKYVPFVLFALLINYTATAQVLTLKAAIDTAVKNYGTIKAKQNYAAASKALVTQSKMEYLPNLNISAQQDYGTINGTNGPIYGFGGLGVASSGAPLSQQNWNAAFGALYLANVNWDFFTFGRVWGKVKAAKAASVRDEDDFEQEAFQHEIRVAGAYLNLLAAQRITLSQQKNLDRAITVKNSTVARANGGLIPGVDSSLAGAEVSAAKIALTNAKTNEQQLASNLAVLMGVPVADFVLDTAFVSRIPASLLAPVSARDEDHPLLKYYQSRIDYSNAQLKYYQHSFYPTLSMFGIVQGRGSGFLSTYTGVSSDFTQNYGNGVEPVRGNYLVGLGINWNLTTIARGLPQVRAQKYITAGMRDEYDLANQQVKAQLALSDSKIKNALDNYNEAPIQVKSATDAYTQKSALYKNGLTTIVDVTQTLYALNRAETDRDIAFSNVWQALLLKAAGAGQPAIFMNEF